MKKRFNMPGIVKNSFLTKEIIPKQIREKGYPFEYILDIEETDYPLEFGRAGNFQLSKIIGGLIDSSLEAIFNTKTPKITQGKPALHTFDEEKPEIDIKVRRVSGKYSIVIKNNGQKLTQTQIKNFEKDNQNIMWAISQFDGKLKIYSESSKTLYHIFIPTPLQNKIYY